eukprot:tig00000711_g3406.t1
MPDEDLAGKSREELVALVQSLRSELAARGTASDQQAQQHAAGPSHLQPQQHPGGKKGGKKPQEQRPFDFSKYTKRHIALKLAYVGIKYDGFAAQENTENSIEAHLFKALQKTCLIKDRASSHYSRCGRTDKGVSALGQVVAFHLRSNLRSGPGVMPADDAPAPAQAAPEAAGHGGSPVAAQPQKKQRTEQPAAPAGQEKERQEINYAHVLNKVLPPDIRVLGWTPVPDDFSARFSCQYREYKYYFMRQNLDIERMREAAGHLVGDHDFRNFCKMDALHVSNFRRVIRSFEIGPSPDFPAPADPEGPDAMFEMRIRGTAFLWHQVRCMAAVLFLVGQGAEEPGVVPWLLDPACCAKKPQYAMAAEAPLCLHGCHFEGVAFRHDPEAHRAAYEGLEEAWRGLAVHAALLRSFLAFMDAARLPLPGPPGPSSAPDAPTAPWREYPRACLIPSVAERERARHIPLARRATEPSYEEKLAAMSEHKRSKMKARPPSGPDDDDDAGD